MTCILGFKIDGHVYIGADSAGTEEETLRFIHRKDSKVFKVRDFVIGGMGSFRMLQLLKYSLVPPKRKATEDIEQYLCSKFIKKLRECFKYGGFATMKDEQESGGDFLVGYQGRLFRIYTDYSVEESLDDYNACGSGAPFALGAMKILENVDMDPEERVTKALEVSEYFNAGVHSPFVIESI
jgi:ATP-dependent protease HslVU (ClpYQ) peptidase subunit